MAGTLDQWFKGIKDGTISEPSVPGGAPPFVRATFVSVTPAKVPDGETILEFHNTASIAGGFIPGGHTDSNTVPGMLGKGHLGLTR